MSDALAYIEAYFQQQLSEAEKTQFERQCEQDDDFAREVAFYITTREAARQSLAEKKKQQWSADRQRYAAGRQRVAAEEPALVTQREAPAGQEAPVRTLPVRRWLPYAAAACLILFATLFYFNGQQTLERQVAGYIQEEISASLSPTMGSLTDSMEQGKQYLKDKNYKQALQVFAAKAQSDKINEDAVLYEGYVYLAMKNYDSALVYFTDVEGRQLSINKGPYNKALALLKRNRKEDKNQATLILQRIVKDSLYGSKEAQHLLDIMK